MRCKSLIPLLLPQFIELVVAKTVHFEIDITTAYIDPVGNGPRRGILMNGSFPGPPLRAQVGDAVEFFVRNHLRQDTAIHFHGIAQSETPWADGTPGTSQQAIRPGSSYLYRWNAEEPGTYFYHGHSRGQIMDGLYGAIVIEPDEFTDRPFHLISEDHLDLRAMMTAEMNVEPLLIADYTQLPFDVFDRAQVDANVEILCMDSIIVNGGGSEYCLPRKTIDTMTDHTVWELLKLVGVQGGLTDKGCLPPLQIVQGDFNMNLEALPEVAFDRCIGGTGERTNLTVNVDSRSGWAALSFINSGAQHPLLVSIDGHNLTVYSVDGQYVHPVEADQIVVGNGNRISVLVRLDQEPCRYYIRVAHQLANQVVAGFAELVYDHSDKTNRIIHSKTDLAGRPLDGINDFRIFGELDSQPYPPKSPSSSANRTHKMLIKKMGRPHTSGDWTLSGTSGYTMVEEERALPLLFDPPHTDDDLFLGTEQGEWVDLIVETEGPISRYHPMHKHGSRFFVVGSGLGRFPWDTVQEANLALPKGSFNFEDPPYVDTVQTRRSMAGAWLVLRYQVEHPGAWLFHCHLQPHFTGGMGVVILDGRGEFPEVPESYLEWNGFEKPCMY